MVYFLTYYYNATGCIPPPLRELVLTNIPVILCCSFLLHCVDLDCAIIFHLCATSIVVSFSISVQLQLRFSLFLFLTVYEYIRPPLWSSGQSCWLQIRRPGFDSRHYQKKVVGLERGPLSLVNTTEELLDRKVAAPV
jgi:hypothetical protein